MKCIYCFNPVIDDFINVPDKGSAHQGCFQLELALRRVSGQLDIINQELTYLKDLVLAEANKRNRGVK